MRIAPAMLAVFVGLLAFSVGAPTNVDAAAGLDYCTNWTSRTQPPPSIRVYRVSEGLVETVDFKAYVLRVVSREWNVKQYELRRAGAVAVKQFAWYHVLHYRGGSHDGKCYDIRDSTADQLYAAKPLEQIPEGVKKAVNSTWTWRLYRNDKFIMTGYRRGEDVGCAKDAGYRLYVRSARKCVSQGWSTARVLRVYYTATLKT